MKKKSKILNKLLTVLMVVLIVAALCVPAFAADIVILPETTVNFDYGEGLISGEFPFIVGETYTVTWNGTAYECVAQDVSSLSPGGVVLGNGSVIGFLGNGEPFVLAYEPGSGLGVISEDSSISSATISISGPDSGSAVPTVNITHTFDANINNDHTDSLATVINFVSGEKYLVTFNDTEYIVTCVSSEYEGLTFYGLGNLSSLFYPDRTQSDDSLPFGVVSGGTGGGSIFWFEPTGESTITITNYEEPFVPSILNTAGNVVTSLTGWIGSVAQMVLNTPVLLIGFTVALATLAFGVFKSLKR